jgi:hypothetical protein
MAAAEPSEFNTTADSRAIRHFGTRVAAWIAQVIGARQWELPHPRSRCSLDLSLDKERCVEGNFTGRSLTPDVIELRRPITEIQREAMCRVEIRIDIPEDLFDDGFTAAAFAARVREFAVIELVRVKRLHEHEAARMLGVERWELVEKMERAGIVPTEKEFDKIKGELGEAIASGKGRIGKSRAPQRR